MTAPEDLFRRANASRVPVPSQADVRRRGDVRRRNARWAGAVAGATSVALVAGTALALTLPSDERSLPPDFATEPAPTTTSAPAPTTTTTPSPTTTPPLVSDDIIDEPDWRDRVPPTFVVLVGGDVIEYDAETGQRLGVVVSEADLGGAEIVGAEPTLHNGLLILTQSGDRLCRDVTLYAHDASGERRVVAETGARDVWSLTAARESGEVAWAGYPCEEGDEDIVVPDDPEVPWDLAEGMPPTELTVVDRATGDVRTTPGGWDDRWIGMVSFLEPRRDGWGDLVVLAHPYYEDTEEQVAMNALWTVDLDEDAAVSDGVNTAEEQAPGELVVCDEPPMTFSSSTSYAVGDVVTVHRCPDGNTVAASFTVEMMNEPVGMLSLPRGFDPVQEPVVATYHGLPRNLLVAGRTERQTLVLHLRDWWDGEEAGEVVPIVTGDCGYLDDDCPPIGPARWFVGR